jgi:2-amino-4-hydroxy-6-hydroxymethyldihydropteridine diphosphokinase
MSIVYLGLGSNLGEKEKNIDKAVQSISTQIGEVLKVSELYYSKAQDFLSVNDFVNVVVLVCTELEPFELLRVTQQIEIELGRITKSMQGYADRIIDIDILLYDELVINEPTLTIPHPRMTERDFVMIPLLEVAAR